MDGRYDRHPDPSLRRDTEESIDASLLHGHWESGSCTRATPGHSWTRSIFDVPTRHSSLCGRVARRVSTLFGIEREAGWNRAALKACSLLRSEDVDVILVTASPFGAFGWQKRCMEIPQTIRLDYRDLYTTNPHYARNAIFHSAKKEQRQLAKSAAVTVVSDSMKQSLQGHFGSRRKDICRYERLRRRGDERNACGEI